MLLPKMIWYNSHDQPRPFQNTPVPYPTMHHSEQKCVHFCSERCIVGYDSGTWWDLWIGLFPGFCVQTTARPSPNAINCFEEYKFIYYSAPFYYTEISQVLDFLMKEWIRFSHMAIAMAADGLVTSGAKASAAMAWPTWPLLPEHSNGQKNKPPSSQLWNAIVYGNLPLRIHTDSKSNRCCPQGCFWILHRYVVTSSNHWVLNWYQET